MVQTNFEGGCFCRAVRYRLHGKPLVSAICHCRTCRKIASAPALPFTTFAAEQFIVTQGSVVEFHSSPGVTRSFCGRCGSPLTYRSDREPETIDVMTCSLDDSEEFAPAYHIWAAQKLGWEMLADGLPVFETTAKED
jgi:hypothetical protein